MNREVKAFISFSLPLLAGAIGSAFTMSAIPTWYASLTKPSFTPANEAFGPAWTALYILMGIALFRVWDTPQNTKEKKSALRIFFIHLVLNTLWSILFFGLQSPFIGLIAILTLLTVLVVVIKKFWHVDRLAGALLIPYLLWVSFATILNAAIWQLNP